VTMLALSAALSPAFVPTTALPGRLNTHITMQEEAAVAAPPPAPKFALETKSDLEALAKKCNPTIGFYDPLGLVDATDSADFINFLRHAEIKHGRVAMAAFVGFVVQSNNIYFPWALTGGPLGDGSSIMHADIAAAGGPGDQWDALPSGAKCQIICAIGLLEFVGEYSPALEADGQKHYLKGGKPGYFPSLKKFAADTGAHPVPLDFWDPFGFTAKMTPERKEKALVAEINNGRLAQIGIMGMLSVSKGLYVPGLDSIEGIKPYAGEYMAPFSAGDAALLGVPEMLKMAETWTWGNQWIPNLY